MFARALVVVGIAACASSRPPLMPEMRMTPAEAQTAPSDTNQIGSSKLPGVHTRVLVGDPTQAGYYSLLLYVPRGTSIQAHSHRDDRMATVVSGTWYFGYGDTFDASRLKELPPGSVYAEPGSRTHNHFAQTRDDDVVVQISGVGPTDTHYVDPAHDPN